MGRPMARLRKPCTGCGREKPPGERIRYCGRPDCHKPTAYDKVKTYNARHPEKVKRARRRYAVENRLKLNAASLRSHHRDPARKLLQLAKARARKRGLLFSLKREHVVIPEVCPVLGIKIVVGGGTGFQDASPTLDRIRNADGYVPGNIVVVSWRANRIKCDATPQELRQLAAFYGDEKWRA